MRIAGIIAEYNPFHNGHEYHLKMTRERVDAVIAVMSGNFVQRAEPAIISKFSRAEAAVMCGVDLVLELPVCWSASSAQTFASGGVSLLNSLRCVDILSFGSECGDVSHITDLARVLDDEHVSGFIKKNLGSGDTFAAIRQKAVESLYGNQLSALLSNPNDILAVEYCKELIRTGSLIKPYAVKRLNAMHDSDDLYNGFASASLIREKIRSKSVVDELLPRESLSVLQRETAALAAPTDIKYLERAILLKLRCTDPSELRSVPDVSEGIENRLIECAKRCSTLEELFDCVKTKRYTHSRIRRIVLSAFLGIRDIPQKVPYARVLAFNDVGAEILKTAKRNSEIPIITKKSEVDKLSNEAKLVFNIENNASEVYAMLKPEVAPFGTEFTNKIFKKLG